MKIRFALPFAMALAACASFGATLQQLSLAQMTQASTAIVRARITSSSASASGLTIYTHYKLQVSEALKGAAPAEFVLPGGVANGYRQSFPGVPSLAAGEYLLFLWTSPSGLTWPVGLSQGILNVSVQADGSAVLSRQSIGELMLDNTGRPVVDHPVQTGLNQLREAIAAVASATPPNGAAK